ncbi:MAG: hypothetical protein HY253_01525 [Burkholderiales bacterium]|nr:hypothetical protein [Burkholderiales bacterium]
MKTNVRRQVTMLLAVGAVVLSGAAVFQAKVSERASAPAIQKVVIAAKRMTATEKLVFDLQNSAMQTVVIRAKRLTAAEKQAIDQMTTPSIATNARAATKA